MKLEEFLRLKDLKKIETALADLISFEQKEDKRIVAYLRLYTYLVMASENFHHHAVTECTYNLRVARKFAADMRAKEERPYADRLVSLADSLLAGMKDVQKKGEYNAEFHKLRVLFRTAQGICIMRILKG